MAEDLFSEGRDTLFAEVLLPIPLPRYFTYRIPHDWNEQIRIGMRVVAPFNRRILTGVVVEIHNTPPESFKAEYLSDLLDEYPALNHIQLKLFEWMANYYLCTPGEVLQAALPSGLKISSQSRIELNPYFEADENTKLSPNELILLDYLAEKDNITYDEAAKLLDVKNLSPILKRLMNKNAVLVFDEVKEKFSPKTQKKVRIHPDWASEEKLNELFELLKNKQKQQEVLMALLRETPLNKLSESNERGCDRDRILAHGVSQSSYRTLLKNNYLEEWEEVVSRFQDIPVIDEPLTLSDIQQEAAHQIMAQFQEKNIVLLHGVTGSGKTAVYLQLIEQVLETGGQVLFLLPEIALTTQMVGRLKGRFGNKMGVYHSRFSDNERVEVWNGVIEGNYPFIVGVRSSLFLPFDNLSLIIVDEEHESSYKQHSPAPRYHARDTALILARQHSAKVLLGSATPAFETYHHALQGKYGLVELHQRFGNAQMPTLEIVNLREEKKAKRMREEFSETLLEELRATIDRDEQAILFQNRRGYSPFITCNQCGWVVNCPNCDVTLVYHLRARELRCHYCSYHEDLPSVCRKCNSPELKTVGMGTQKIEDELQILMPDIRISRMDLDTTRSKNAYQRIIEEFAAKETQVLVGTQMVTKGLDFDSVGLVGVFDIDRLLHYPDFRSHERAFQLITQVSGRAGRKDTPGKVIIQSANPAHFVLQKVLENDYRTLYDHEIAEREKYYYPPFVRIIKVVVRNADKQAVWDTAERLAERIAAELGEERVLGPQAPVIERLRNLYLREIHIKLERGKIAVSKVKEMLFRLKHELRDPKTFRQADIYFDVDPV